MNKRQKICLWIGIIIFTIIGIASYTNGYIDESDTYLPLLINWAITIVITSGFIYTFKDKKESP